MLSDSVEDPATLLFAAPFPGPKAASAAHPAYSGWSYTGDVVLEKAALEQITGKRPASLFRLKGHVHAPGGAAWEVHAVGQHVSVKACAAVPQTQLVAIGLASLVDLAEVDAWWAGAP